MPGNMKLRYHGTLLACDFQGPSCYTPLSVASLLEVQPGNICGMEFVQDSLSRSNATRSSHIGGAE
eukprot:4979565-Amphidinium_carterae.1